MEIKEREDRKMGKYIIKADSSNPEYAPDSELVKGIEADGFVLLVKHGDKMCDVIIHGVSVIDLARALAAGEDNACSKIWQAVAIAEGLKKAKKIADEEEKTNARRAFAELLRMK